jgi:hypothetical protein
LLGELVTIRDECEIRQVTVEEAFLLQLMHKGLKGEVTRTPRKVRWPEWWTYKP